MDDPPVFFTIIVSLHFQVHSLVACETVKGTPGLENILAAPIDLAINFLIRTVGVMMK